MLQLCINAIIYLVPTGLWEGMQPERACSCV